MDKRNISDNRRRSEPYAVVVFLILGMMMFFNLAAEGTLFVGLEGSAPPTFTSDLTGFPNVTWTSSYAFDVSGAAAAPDGTIYICNGAFTTHLYQATLTTPPQLLCTISEDMSSLAYANGTLYGFSNYADPKGIYSINTATGQATLVLDVHTGTSYRFFALDYNPQDGLFYGYTEYGGTGLYSINITTGVMSQMAGAIPATNGQGRGMAVGDNIVYLTATRGDDGIGYFAYDLAQGAGGNWLEFPNPYPNHHSTGGAAWIPDQTPYIEIQGMVEPGDLPGSGLAGCDVILSGDQTYQTQTDDSGFFLLENVAGYILYTLEISHPDYQTYSTDLQTLESNIDLGTIILNETAFPAQNVLAEVNDEYTEVELSWQAPAGRILEYYEIYRFLEINSVVPSFWELLADNFQQTNYIDEDWLWLEPEFYQYAVVAVYTNGLEAEAALSNVLQREYFYYAPFDPEVISNPAEDFAAFSWNAYQLDYLEGFNVYLDYQLQDFTEEMEWQFADLVNGQTYIAGVEAVYSTGVSQPAEILFIYEGVDAQPQEIPHNSPLISHFSVYPNPFNPSTTISFSFTTEITGLRPDFFGTTPRQAEDTELVIYNLKGQRVRTLDCCNSLAANARDSRSTYSVVWNGTDDNNRPVASGVYLLRLQVSDVKLSRKVLLLR